MSRRSAASSVYVFPAQALVNGEKKAEALGRKKEVLPCPKGPWKWGPLKASRASMSAANWHLGLGVELLFYTCPLGSYIKFDVFCI